MTLPCDHGHDGRCKPRYETDKQNVIASVVLFISNSMRVDAMDVLNIVTKLELLGERTSLEVN